MGLSGSRDWNREETLPWIAATLGVFMLFVYPVAQSLAAAVW